MIFDIMRLNANFGIVCDSHHKIFITWRLVLGVVYRFSFVFSRFTGILPCYSSHLIRFFGYNAFYWTKIRFSSFFLPLQKYIPIPFHSSTIWNAFFGLVWFVACEPTNLPRGNIIIIIRISKAAKNIRSTHHSDRMLRSFMLALNVEFKDVIKLGFIRKIVCAFLIRK